MTHPDPSRCISRQSPPGPAETAGRDPDPGRWQNGNQAGGRRWRGNPAERRPRNGICRRNGRTAERSR